MPLTPLIMKLRSGLSGGFQRVRVPIRGCAVIRARRMDAPVLERIFQMPSSSGSLDQNILNTEYVPREATWLILPVVICLSQRLSHACLSIRGHLFPWDCEWLIKSVIVYLMVPPTRITVVILELIRAQCPVRDAFIRAKSNAELARLDWWNIVTPRIAWPCAGDASFKFLPYQLSMVG